jgi:membrane protein YdbS with pleckstrin-like domain
VTRLRWRRADDPLAGSLDLDSTRPPAQPPGRERGHDPAAQADESDDLERPPGALRRFGQALAEVRRRVLPLPDEVIEDYLGNGERMIHNDHPSFRSFVVQNTLLFGGFLIVGVLFLGITFSGSLLAAGFLLLVLCVVLLVLVLKRLGDRYTSYVVTDTRIMRISGVITRRAHSIPWVRVTDLSIEQSFMGRLFGYATLHIESANEDSGLRDLDGVSDPMQFNQYVVDMVVAKQGSTTPNWEQAGEPAPIGLGRGLRRIRLSRRRRAADDGPGRTHGGPGQTTTRRRPSGGDPAAPGAGSTGTDEGDVEDLDPETLARQLRSSPGDDLPWGG